MIYVSGPVVEKLDKTSLHARIYKSIEQIVSNKHKVELPIRASALTKLSPPEFYNAIASKIIAADGVITLWVPNDQSTVVETTTAALSDKHQCVLFLSKTSPPRIMRGLPKVLEVTEIGPTNLDDEVRRVVERLLKSIG